MELVRRGASFAVVATAQAPTDMGGDELLYLAQRAVLEGAPAFSEHWQVFESLATVENIGHRPTPEIRFARHHAYIGFGDFGAGDGAGNFVSAALRCQQGCGCQCTNQRQCEQVQAMGRLIHKASLLAGSPFADESQER